MPRKCVVCGALHSINLPVFAFPKSSHLRGAWVTAIQQIIPGFCDPNVDGRRANKHGGVCERHFDCQDIRKGKKTSLHQKAVPLLSSISNSEGTDDGGVESLAVVPLSTTGDEKSRSHFLMDDENEFRDTSIGHMTIESRAESSWQVDDTQTKDHDSCLSINIEDYLTSENAYDESAEGLENDHAFVFSKKETLEMDVCLVCGKEDKNSNLIYILGLDEHSNSVSSSILLAKIVCRSKREVLSVSMMICSRCENLVQEVALIEEDLKFKKHNLKSMFEITLRKYKERTKVDVGSTSTGNSKPTDIYSFDANCSRNIVFKSNLSEKIDEKRDLYLGEKLSDKVKKRSQRQASAKKYCCPQCQEVYTSLALWVQHLSKHSDMDDLKAQTNNKQVTARVKKPKTGIHTCEECGKTFLCKQSLLAHSSGHQKVCECSVCGRFLTTKARLKAHMFKFHGIGEEKNKEVACQDCGKCFGTKAGLRYHRNVVHHVGAKYVCEKCNKIFYYHVPYRSHLLYAHGERKIVCETCGEKFFTISKLNTHINAVHRSAQSWTCDECESKFTTYTAYRHHMNVKHYKVHHTCDICSAQFRKKSSLLIHLGKHSVYICHLCRENFSCSDSLRTHMSVAHGKDINLKSRRKQSSSLLLQEKKLVGEEDVLQKTSPVSDGQIEQNEHVASIVINDLLMTAESYDNSSLQPFSLSCEKMPEKHPHPIDEDIKVKTLSIINATQDLQTIDPLQFGAVETLEVKSSHDHIEMAPGVSLINVQILGDMEISQSDTLGDLKSSMLTDAADHLSHDDQLDNKNNMGSHLTVETHLSVGQELEHSSHTLEATDHLEAACQLEASDPIESTCHLDTRSHLGAESSLEVSNQLASPNGLDTTDHLEVSGHIETGHLDATDHLSSANHLDSGAGMTVTGHLDTASHIEPNDPLPIPSHIDDPSSLDASHHLEVTDQCSLPGMISEMESEVDREIVESVNNSMVTEIDSDIHNMASDVDTHLVECAESSMVKGVSPCMGKKIDACVAEDNLDKQIEKMDEVELQPFSVTLDGKGEVQYQYVMYISAPGEDSTPG